MLAGLLLFDLLKQFANRIAISQQVVGAVLAVEGFQVVDAHRVIDGMHDVLRSDRAFRRVGGDFIAGTVNLPATDAAAGQERGLTVRPVIQSSRGV